MASLALLVDQILTQAVAGPPAVRPYVEAARAAVGADMTIVVAGRRGVGKTTLINGLLGAEAGVTGFSAEDRRTQIFAAVGAEVRGDVAVTHVSASFLQGRRLIELPDSSDGASWRTAIELAGQKPDLLLYVAQQELRTDELDLVRRSIDAWGLAPMDVLVVLVEPASDASSAEAQGRLQTLGRRMERTSPGLFAQVTAVEAIGAGPERFSRIRSRVYRLERFCEARRAISAVTILTDMTAAHRDSGWAEGLHDALERLQLAPEAHAMSERWALDQCLRGGTELRTELRAELLDFYLSPETSEVSTADAAQRRELLARRAARFRVEVARSSPRAAMVARTVVRSCQLRINEALAQSAPITPSESDPRELRYVHA